MPEENAPVYACLLDGKGGGTPGGWEMVRRWAPEQGVLWVHLDRKDLTAQRWLAEETAVDEITRAALLAEETRPRTLVRGSGLLVVLRGVNLNPDAEPDDMISIRMYLQERRIISLRHRHLMAIDDLKAQIEDGHGPEDPGEFLVDLAHCLLRRMATSMADLEERVDSLDERIMTEAGASLRAEIADIRREVIALRRYLAPQRDAVARLQTEKVSWLTDVHRERLREIADRTTRRVEDLDEARDHAAVAHEELSGRMAEQMNRTMYILAIVAAVFLPLGLITGLLGINVGGMPGTEHSHAFWIVCGLLGVMAAFQWWLFKKMKWL